MATSRAARITTAWFRMARTVERVYRDMEQLYRAHGITSPQFDVLATLLRHGELSQQALAGQLLVTKGNVSFVLGRMEAAGLISREADAGDPRANRIAISPRGRTLFDAIMPEHDSILARRFGALSSDQLQAVVDAVRVLDREA